MNISSVDMKVVLNQLEMELMPLILLLYVIFMVALFISQNQTEILL